METNFDLKTTTDELGAHLIINAVLNKGQHCVADCAATVYPDGVCDIMGFRVARRFQANLAAHAVVVLREVIAIATEKREVTQFYCWDIAHPESIAIFSDVFPYNFYFTHRGEVVEAKKAHRRLKRHKFILWRGFEAEPEQPVRGIIPVDNPHIEKVMRDELKKGLCAKAKFSPSAVKLLVKHFLGKPLTEKERARLFEPGKLLDRFSRCIQREHA